MENFQQFQSDRISVCEQKLHRVLRRLKRERPQINHLLVLSLKYGVKYGGCDVKDKWLNITNVISEKKKYVRIVWHLVKALHKKLRRSSCSVLIPVKDRNGTSVSDMESVKDKTERERFKNLYKDKILKITYMILKRETI